MKNKIEPATLKDWEAFEAEKNAEKEKALKETTALTTKRAIVLAGIAAGSNTRADLIKLDEDIKNLAVDVEILDAALAAIPEKKNFARGIEIEKAIPAIKEIDAGIAPLMEDVQAKAKTLIEAVKKFYDHLGGFDSVSEARSLALKYKFVSAGVNGLSAYGMRGKPGGGNSIDLDIALLQMVYEPDTFSSWISAAHDDVLKRINKMKHHARWLKDKNYPDPEWAYCPNCYGNIGYANYKEICHCSECGKSFPSEHVPGAKPRMTPSNE